jgi:hypothetical protein
MIMGALSTFVAAQCVGCEWVKQLRSAADGINVAAKSRFRHHRTANLG